MEMSVSEWHTVSVDSSLGRGWEMRQWKDSFVSGMQPWCNPLWLTGLKVLTNKSVRNETNWDTENCPPFQSSGRPLSLTNRVVSTFPIDDQRFLLRHLHFEDIVLVPVVEDFNSVVVILNMAAISLESESGRNKQEPGTWAVRVAASVVIGVSDHKMGLRTQPSTAPPF